jgi:hypothetical protein
MSAGPNNYFGGTLHLFAAFDGAGTSNHGEPLATD